MTHILDRLHERTTFSFDCTIPVYRSVTRDSGLLYRKRSVTVHTGHDGGEVLCAASPWPANTIRLYNTRLNDMQE